MGRRGTSARQRTKLPRLPREGYALDDLSQPPAEFYDRQDDASRCFACGNPRFRPLAPSDDYGFPVAFQRCECGLTKQIPMPNERFFEWFFNSKVFFSARETGAKKIWGFYDYFADEDCRLQTSRLRYERFRPFLEGRGPLDILKIGPSTGSFLHVAQEHGHRVLGCDVSTRFIDFARDTYGVRIDHGRFERLAYGDARFDAIFLFNVIENVPDQEEFLDAIRRALRPGGRLFVNFVDMRGNLLERLQGSRYFLYRPPICYAFERDTMRRILAKFGFAVEAGMRDLRVMHLEKISTLLGWRWPLAFARPLGLERRPFRVYAYPSRIFVARRER